MGKEVVLSIGVVGVVLTVLLTLLFMAIVDFGSEAVIPTGEVVFASEKRNSLEGSVDVVIERLRFPLANNLMIVSLKNNGKTTLTPTLRIMMTGDVLVGPPIPHCDITPDALIQRLSPGRKQFVEVSFKGCSLFDQQKYDTVTMTVYALQDGTELGKVTRRLDLRG